MNYFVGEFSGSWPWDSHQTHDSHHRRPILRGVLIRLVDRWIDNPDGLTQRREAILAVPCPHCDRQHYHGWDPANNGRHSEHRAPHCGGGNPGYPAGYWISVVRKGDPGYSDHVVRPGVPIVRQKPTPLRTEPIAATAASTVEAKE